MSAWGKIAEEAWNATKSGLVAVGIEKAFDTTKEWLGGSSDTPNETHGNAHSTSDNVATSGVEFSNGSDIHPPSDPALALSNGFYTPNVAHDHVTGMGEHYNGMGPNDWSSMDNAGNHMYHGQLSDGTF